MNKKNKFCRKIITALVIFNFIFYQLFLPVSIYGQETVSPVPDEQTQTPQAENQTIITTGDSVAEAATQTETNTDEATVDGDITAQDCTVSGSLECSTQIDNNAETDIDASASSTTGQNENTNPEGDALTQTGDSSADAINANLVNTVVIEATPSAENQPENENKELNPISNDDPQFIDINNNADHESQTDAASNTGQNSNLAQENSDIDTGDAIATTANVNMVNVNLVGSDLELINIAITQPQSGDIDLNETYKQLQEKINENSATLTFTVTSSFVINIDNQANVDATASATAISGQNDNTADNTTTKTGDAIASNGIFNLVNFNLIGSNMFVVFINILDEFEGDIILPGLERFSQDDTGFYPYLFTQTDINIHNQADINIDSQTNSDSGNNNLAAGGMINSGDSTALSTQTTITDQNIFLSKLYLLFINNFGFWDGSIYSWNNPSEVAVQEGQSGQYQNATDQITPEDQSGTESESGSGTQTTADDDNIALSELSLPLGQKTAININNNAVVNVDADATAICGQNNASGLTGIIISGKCIAVNNIFSLINTNAVGSKIILPIINIMGRGRWKGNLVFAYPDLAIDIATDKTDVVYGDIINYQVSYHNQGHETARNASITVDLPSEASLLNTSGPNPTANGSSLTFNVGDIKAGQTGNFSLSVKVNQKQLTGQNNIVDKLLSFIIPSAHAQENSKSIITSAGINTGDAETNTDNNYSSTTQYLRENDNEIIVESTKGETNDNPYPVLSVTSNNNVGTHILPRDTIRFEAQLINNGDTSHKTVLIQEIYDQDNNYLAQRVFDLDQVVSGETKAVTFGLTVPSPIATGNYKSLIYAQGYDRNNQVYFSNESVTGFYVKGNLASGIQLVKQVKAQEKIKKEKVLGVNDVVKDCPQKTDYIPYILAFILASLLFVENRKRVRLEQELKKSLEKPAK